MTNKQIQAVGNFLTYYQKDLYYIKSFHDFKAGEIAQGEYVKRNYGSFYSYLIEFRVVRNFPKGTINKLLSKTISWIGSEKQNDVDAFSSHLKYIGVTNYVMASMASKILFLNNPWKIIPMDQLARGALDQKENLYSMYVENLTKFNNTNQNIIERCLGYTQPLTDIIELEYKDLQNIEVRVPTKQTVRQQPLFLLKNRTIDNAFVFLYQMRDI